MSTEDVIISQPAGTRTLALRESYLAICGGDKCEAHLLNSLERWYAYKLKNRRQARHANRTAQAGGEAPTADEGLWVFMSAQEWVTELLNQYDEKTVRTKLTRLVERGFVDRRSNPTRPWDRKPQWLFQRSAVQAAVDAWGGGRGPQDLDPEGLDGPGTGENSRQDESGIGTETIRENARMQSGKVPDASGQRPASIRANARSNTTGISHRDPSQESVTGGEHNVTRDARAHEAAEPTAPVAEPTPAPVTTTIAVREDFEGLSAPVASVAVVSPDGEAADAAITDTELEFLFGHQAPATQEPETVTEVKKVSGGPAAPRGAQEAQEDPSGSELAPHDPESTRRVLMPALGGQKKLNSLMEEAPPSLRGKTRRGWITEITPARAAELIIEARREAGADNPWTYIIRALDQELGAQFKKGQQAGGGVRGWNADVTSGANFPQAKPAVDPEPEQPADTAGVGTSWEHKHTAGRIVTVTAVDGGYVELDGSERMLRFLLHKDFKRVN